MRHHRHVWMLLGMVCVLVTTIGGGWAVLAHNANAQPHGSLSRSNDIPSPSCYRWSAYAGPDVGSNSTSLSAVAAVPGSTQLWAVGAYHNTSVNFDQTVTAHYDGTSWRIVSSPNIVSMENYLQGVVVVSANDVWAVGYAEQVASASYQTLIEHWNGTSWSIVPSPNPSAFLDQLNAVAAVSATDIWAVGTYVGSNSQYQTLAEQWNGSSWSVVPSPNGTLVSPRGPHRGAFPNNQLYGVTAVSATDIWAVGTDNGFTVTLHWNGAAWSLIPSPSDSGFDELNAVAAVSSNDVMAVGYSNTSGVYSTLAEQWNGTSWSIVPTPTEGTANTMNFLAITAVPGTETFLAVGVGGYFGALNGGTTTQIAIGSRMGTQPGITSPANDLLMERWNGTGWGIVSMPSPVLYTTGLTGIVARSPTNIWAVGNYQLPHQIFQTLIERYLPNAMGFIC